MSTVVGSYQAKTHLPRLLARVAQGERFTITRHGQPVAELVPVGGADRQKLAQAVEGLRHFANGRSLGRLKLRQLINEGRRH